MSESTQQTDDEAAVESAPDEDLETEEKETVSVDHDPPRLSKIIATAAVFVGVALTGPFNLIGALFGVASLGIVAGSLFLRVSRGYLSIGVGLGLFGALVTGGYGSVPPIFMLVAVSALFVGWSVGQNGISIGNQLGSDTRTSRLELVHAGVTTLVVATMDIVAFGVFQLSASGQPAPAVALILIGAIVLIWTLGD